MRKLFGTDGIRGVANAYPMTPEMILLIGRAAAYKVKDSKKRCRIIIGKDTRLSGYMIETSLSAGICSMGVDVLLIGPMPTPAVSYLTRSMRADAGVVISASHNPYQDNGIKIFSAVEVERKPKIATVPQVVEAISQARNRARRPGPRVSALFRHTKRLPCYG